MSFHAAYDSASDESGVGTAVGDDAYLSKIGLPYEAVTWHMPMVQQKLGPACKRMAVEQGIAGGAPGAPATYVAMGHLYFDSTDAFQAAFAPHAQSILADIPNYTNTQPTIQVSEVRL